MARPRNTNDYAIYKGEELLHIGTLDELSEVTGLKRKTIRWMCNPAYQKRCEKSNKRKIVIRSDDDDD